MTLGDLQGRSPIASFLNRDYFVQLCSSRQDLMWRVAPFVCCAMRMRRMCVAR